MKALKHRHRFPKKDCKLGFWIHSEFSWTGLYETSSDSEVVSFLKNTIDKMRSRITMNLNFNVNLLPEIFNEKQNLIIKNKLSTQT